MGDFSFKVRVSGSFAGVFSEEFDELSAKNREALEGTSLFLKNRLRAQVAAAGLGKKLEKAWQSDVYPRRNVRTLHPKALVYSKAPKLHMAYDTGGTIVAKNGARFLAIPTQNVPNLFSPRRKMTPEEVESSYNQDLIFEPYGSGRPGGFLVLKKVIEARNKRGWRKATKRRMEQKGREVQEVTMFFLIPSARLKKSLDIEGAIRESEADLVSRLTRG